LPAGRQGEYRNRHFDLPHAGLAAQRRLAAHGKYRRGSGDEICSRSKGIHFEWSEVEARMSDPPLRGLIRPTIHAASMRRASQVGSKAEGLEPT
jgi:hypothetical protein